LLFLFLAGFLLTDLAAARVRLPLYPIRQHDNRIWSTRITGHFLIIGDARTPLVNLNDADARAISLTRQQTGYNTLWVELLRGTMFGTT